MNGKVVALVSDRADEIIDAFNKDQSFLMHLLLELQKEVGWLPREVIEKVSSRLSVPLTRIYHIATFYKTFSLTPRGRHQLSLCLGTACHVRGAPLIRDYLEQTLDIKAGETTADLAYTLEAVNCLGACALGPILVLDNVLHGSMTIHKTNRAIKGLDKKVVNEEEV